MYHEVILINNTFNRSVSGPETCAENTRISEGECEKRIQHLGIATIMAFRAISRDLLSKPEPFETIQCMS